MDKGKKKRDSRTTEQPAVRTTIVGGRPPGPGKGVGAVPRGVEVLVKKAAVDPEFKVLLLAERSAAAAEIGLELSDAEADMLDGVPVAQLEAIIASTTVSPKLRPAFAGRVAAVMLAALGTGSMVYANGVSDSTELVITQQATSSGGLKSDEIAKTDEEKDVEIDTGTIFGRVTDVLDVPFENAAVKIKELDIVVYTDKDGYYDIDNIPAGFYTVDFRFPQHSTLTVTGVMVKAGMKTNVSCSDIHLLTLGIRPDVPRGWAD